MDGPNELQASRDQSQHLGETDAELGGQEKHRKDNRTLARLGKKQVLKVKPSMLANIPLMTNKRYSVVLAFGRFSVLVAPSSSLGRQYWRACSLGSPDLHSRD